MQMGMDFTPEFDTKSHSFQAISLFPILAGDLDSGLGSTKGRGGREREGSDSSVGTLVEPNEFVPNPLFNTQSRGDRNREERCQRQIDR